MSYLTKAEIKLNLKEKKNRMCKLFLRGTRPGRKLGSDGNVYSIDCCDGSMGVH